MGPCPNHRWLGVWVSVRIQGVGSEFGPKGFGGWVGSVSRVVSYVAESKVVGDGAAFGPKGVGVCVR